MPPEKGAKTLSPSSIVWSKPNIKKLTRELNLLRFFTFLAIVISLLFGFMKYILSFGIFDVTDATLLIMYGPFFMMAYIYFRYMLSGTEFTEVADAETYKKARRSIIKSAIVFGVLFAIFYFIPFGPKKEGLEAIAFVGLMVFFYFLFDYISLKRSYTKNKDLSDD